MNFLKFYFISSNFFGYKTICKGHYWKKTLPEIFKKCLIKSKSYDTITFFTDCARNMHHSKKLQYPRYPYRGGKYRRLFLIDLRYSAKNKG